MSLIFDRICSFLFGTESGQLHRARLNAERAKRDAARRAARRSR